MFEEDDVALEVFWIFYVIVSFCFLSIFDIVVGSVGHFIGVVDPTVGLFEVPSKLSVFLGRLLRVRDASVGGRPRVPVVAISGGVSHFATNLAHKFGVISGLDLLSLGGLGWLLLVLAMGFGLCFLPEAFPALNRLVAMYSAVATLAIKFSFCLPVLLGLDV